MRAEQLSDCQQLTTTWEPSDAEVTRGLIPPISPSATQPSVYASNFYGLDDDTVRCLPLCSADIAIVYEDGDTATRWSCWGTIGRFS